MISRSTIVIVNQFTTYFDIEEFEIVALGYCEYHSHRVNHSCRMPKKEDLSVDLN
jgi:hypothetical protein